MSQNATIEELETWRTLTGARHMIKRLRERELALIGISLHEAGVFHAVKAIGEETTPAKISRFLSLHPNTVSGMLNKMEKKGWVNKTNDLTRKNHIRISITEKGEKLFNLIDDTASIHRVFSSFSDEQLSQLRFYLKTVYKNALEELNPKKKDISSEYLRRMGLSQDAGS